MAEVQDVGGVGVGDGGEAESFVEAGGAGVFRAETDGTEVFPCFRDEGEDEGCAEALTAPVFADEDAADAGDLGIVCEGVAVEAVDGD